MSNYDYDYNIRALWFKLKAFQQTANQYTSDYPTDVDIEYVLDKLQDIIQQKPIEAEPGIHACVIDSAGGRE